MPLTILSDKDVQAVLETLTKEDVVSIHMALAEALHQYSTIINAEDSGCAAANQPSRIAVKSRDGGTILFMPASSDTAFGVKIVTLSETCKNNSSVVSLPELGSLSTSDSNGSDANSKQSMTSRSSSPSVATSKTSISSKRSSSPSHSVSHIPDTANTARLGKVKTEPDQPDMVIPGTPVDLAPSSATSPRGSITLLTPDGQPRALLNASTLTAFRTAMVSTMLFMKRESVHNVTIFGAGLQAFWHLWVSILLRGPEIHHINIVNRSFIRAQRMIMSLGQTGNDTVANTVMNPKFQSAILTPEYKEYTRLLKEYVRSADVIYCTTPATTPLFPASFLTSSNGRQKPRYVAAIGSYKPHMQELHEDILRQATKTSSDEHRHSLPIHLHKRHATEGGAIIVDTIEGAMREAGEVIKAGISGNSVVELGELMMLKKSHKAELEERDRQEQRKQSTGDVGKDQHKDSHHGLGKLFHLNEHDNQVKEERQRVREIDGGLMDWLQRGNVIYKGVGIGLMDVTVGMEIVKIAELRGIGTHLKEF